MIQTLDRIRRDGLAALQKKLGRAGMIRFLQQFDAGRGDYTSERRDWVDHATMDDLRKAGGSIRRPRPRRS